MSNVTLYHPFADPAIDDLFRGFFRPVRGEREAVSIKLDVAEKDNAYVNTFVITPHGDMTTVEKIQDTPDPTGFMKVAWPIMNAVFVHGAQQKGMDMLKAKAEGASSG